ncbi:MAG: DUF1579 domain-containing protein [Planctomycetota bacterium]|nr:MAG: DUF1579 domain-containing protein [Planctomycetota bacterium]
MADPKTCTEATAITDEHRRFEPFVGTFKARVRIWTGPGEPHVSTGVMTNTLDLGGRYLKQVYRGDAANGPFPGFEGRGFWGYNPVEQRYEGFWIDNASCVMQIDRGEVDASGTVWTMIGEMSDPQSGGTIRKRSVITLQDRNRHTMEMYIKPPQGDEFKVMEIRYERAS